MDKIDFFIFSPIEAFRNGKECKIKGYSINYNPYRNIDITKCHTLSILYTSWIEGWKYH
jgi:hypothetical protein